MATLPSIFSDKWYDPTCGPLPGTSYNDRMLALQEVKKAENLEKDELDELRMLTSHAARELKNRLFSMNYGSMRPGGAPIRSSRRKGSMGVSPSIP
jgi:hypothetical protein